MAKVAILVPRQSMAEQAERVIRENPHENLSVNEIRVIGTSNAVNEARSAVANGAEIIIARGLQAIHIKEHTNIPVVEIILTGQDLALLVMEAKQTVGKEHPHIAFVGNVFSDMSHFEELFGITLSLYRYRDMEEHMQKIAEVVDSGADIIVGGDMSNQLALEHGIPFLFFHSTEESMREALRVAALTGFAMDVEKRHSAQIEALLDSYTNGMILIDTHRRITKVNHIAVEMLGKPEEELDHAYIHALIPGLDTESIDRLLSNALNIYQTTLQIGEQTVTIWASPFKEEGLVVGAALICHSTKTVYKSTQMAIRNMHLRGYTAKEDFRHINTASKLMKHVIDSAKLFAISQSPVLVIGETGTEKDLIAQGIHQASVRKNGPFISMDCICADEKEQEGRLFGQADVGGKPIGQKGALEVSSYGTIYLNDIDALSLNNQYRLYRALTARTLSYDNVRPELVLDIRLVASTTKDLETLMRGGLFREDLYYTINALSLEVPPVRRRPEDVYMLMKALLEACAEIYHRQISLTTEAWEVLRDFTWPGNLIQMRSFCERLVLTAPKQKVDAAFARYLLNGLYPTTGAPSAPAITGISTHPEAAQIVSLLEKHYGNRNSVANEMGISVTTLWRRMKKHGIVPNI